MRYKTVINLDLWLSSPPFGELEGAIMKKVLIITYYWPPAGGPGVQRVLKFAKYLPQFGWEPVILTVENGNFPAIDEGLVEEIPENLKVYRTKTLEPFAIYNKFQGKDKSSAVDTFTITKTGKSFKDKLGNAIRSYFFIPDARKGWRPFAVKKGLEIIKQEKIDLIFSSSPPHSLQLIAKKLSKETKLPWVADFRDPWSTAFWLDESQKKGWVNKQNIKKESAVFKDLNHFTTVSHGVLDSFKNLYPHIKENSTLLYNGYDTSDFEAIAKVKNEKFTIRYVGTLAMSQNPELLFESLAQIKRNSAEVASKLKVEFWGKFDQAIKDSVDKYDVADIVEFYGYVSHAKAVELMQNGDMLILVIPEGKGILTGKLFEYIATGNQVLGFGPKDCEAQILVEKNGFGFFAHSANQLVNSILEDVVQWESGKLSTKQSGKEQFSRKKLTEKLSTVFNKTLEGCS